MKGQANRPLGARHRHPKRLRRRVPVLLALLTLGGPVLVSCEGGAPADGDGPSLLDPAGLPLMEVRETFSLGGPDAPEEEVFTRAPSIAVAPDGTLFVLARSAQEVRRYARDGTFLDSMGGEGEGPGEFQNALRLGLVGDTVWVRNLSPPFVSFFTPEGVYLRTERYPDAVISRTGVPEGPEAMLSGGGWFTVGVVPWGSPGGPTTVPLVVVSPEGDVRDTLGLAMVPSVVRIEGIALRGMGSEPRSPIHDVVPGGGAVLLAEWDGGEMSGGTVVLHRHRPDGSLVRGDTISFEPVPLEPTVADSVVSAAADSLRAAAVRVREAGIPDPSELPNDLTAAVRDALDLGRTFRPIRGLLAGIDGTVWLERVVGPSEGEWVVLDAELEPLFRVDLPRGVVLQAGSRRSVWVTRTDDLGVPYVVRGDLVPATGTR